MPLSKKHVTKLYRKMLLQSKREVSPNRVNCYICPKCMHITKTIDVDPGVTPAFHNCEQCGEFAHSTFYNDKAIGISPTQEWFRPSLVECIAMRKNQPALLDHILKGGLDVRKIKKASRD